MAGLFQGRLLKRDPEIVGYWLLIVDQYEGKYYRSLLNFTGCPFVCIYALLKPTVV